MSKRSVWSLALAFLAGILACAATVSIVAGAYGYGGWLGGVAVVCLGTSIGIAHGHGD